MLAVCADCKKVICTMEFTCIGTSDGVDVLQYLEV